MTSERLHGGSFICVQKAEQWEVFTFVHSGPDAGQVTECASQELQKEDRAIMEIGCLDQRPAND
jgi:hypothetical protein